jgi:addiction module HigA family antidote
LPQILRQQLTELGLTQRQLADALNVSLWSVNQLCNGRRGITADMALRLSVAFNTSPDYWMKMQANQDLADTLNSPMDCLMREGVTRLPGVP